MSKLSCEAGGRVTSAKKEPLTHGSPLAIDLYCGLGGWAEGFLAEGYRVIGFDIERHDYGTGGYPGQLVIQDVTTLHGSQFKDAAVIVASPPCQEYSYMAMPWSRAKERIRKYESGELDVKDLTRLFDACFRIQREASEAAGRHIPLIVENVRGANRWVGRARWHFGSYFLWGDVPALMPMTLGNQKVQSPHLFLRDPSRKNVQKLSLAPKSGIPSATDDSPWKVPGQNWSNFNKTGKVSPHWRMQLLEQRPEAAKGNGSWFGDYKEAKAAGRGSANRYTSSNSVARRAAAAAIAKIPFTLAQHIAQVFKPAQP